MHFWYLGKQGYVSVMEGWGYILLFEKGPMSLVSPEYWSLCWRSDSCDIELLNTAWWNGSSRQIYNIVRGFGAITYILRWPPGTFLTVGSSFRTWVGVIWALILIMLIFKRLNMWLQWHGCDRRLLKIACIWLVKIDNRHFPFSQCVRELAYSKQRFLG